MVVETLSVSSWSTRYCLVELLILDGNTYGGYPIPPDTNRRYRRISSLRIDLEPMLEQVQFPFRKYNKDTVKFALDAILNDGISVTQASIIYGIKRTSLQHYLKRLNIKVRQ